MKSGRHFRSRAIRRRLYTFGVILAALLSYGAGDVWQWVILHGAMSWFYVAWFLYERVH